MKTPVRKIKVGLDFGSGVQPGERLAIHNDRIYFEYEASFVQSNLEISPIKLPLQSGLVELPQKPSEGFIRKF